MRLAGHTPFVVLFSRPLKYSYTDALSLKTENILRVHDRMERKRGEKRGRGEGGERDREKEEEREGERQKERESGEREKL